MTKLRARATVRRWLVAVALIAAVLAGAVTLGRRALRFRALADFSYAGTVNGRPREVGGSIIVRGKEAAARERRLQALGRKYDAAAARPWLPAPP